MEPVRGAAGNPRRQVVSLPRAKSPYNWDYSEMSISSKVAKLSTLPRRRPLVFNALVYGSLYTSAEFLQQTWTKRSNLKLPEEKLHSPAIIAVTTGAHAWPVVLIQKFNNVLGLDRDKATVPGDYNWAQLKRFAIYGCLLAGPILHEWYRWLDAVYSGNSKRIVFKKLLVDQFVLTPALLAFFFVVMNIMEGKFDIFAECKAKFVATFLISCVYWMPVQTLNFMVVPPVFRVIYVGVAAFCWVNILCYVKRQPQLGEKEKGKERKNEKSHTADGADTRGTF